MNQTTGFNSVLHKGHQALSRRIGDTPHANASDHANNALYLALKPYFQRTWRSIRSFRQYDVSADGKRFLLAQPLDESAAAPITVIVNWPALLKKEAGAP
jgi:hypothetical protein